MPRFDLGGESAPPAVSAAPQALRIECPAEGKSRVLTLLPFAVVEAGRHSG
jgi:hypothetical protein